jgi:hypothetical protein
LAADATALPVLFAPVTVASLAVLMAPLLFVDLDVLRREDAAERDRLCDEPLPFERRVLDRGLVAARRFAAELRVVDRLLFELRPDFLLVC